ncbi:COG1470 family protein [Metabacillus malikii]|uniref:Membrane protein n=1 Tax=Metabacillus malikii TaxID=1504265 RepID=A0ABT9ZPK5_9BACI|nr:NEW3 domain-containing protein [Metabacillus malikii]MDQ0233448.1 putative membrane protein [Metabacillus malikii]
MLKRNVIAIFTIAILVCSLLHVNRTYAIEGVSLFTSYTGISATPGETINYQVDVINSSSSIKSMTFELEDLPKDWTYKISSNEMDIKELSVKGNSETPISVDITVPQNAKMGDNNIKLVATDGSSKSTLNLAVAVTEQGSYKTELTTEQANLEGHSESTFSYTVTLNNKTAKKQNYSLSTSADDGWVVRFLSDSNSVTSLSLEPNTSKDLTVEVTPPKTIEKGTYEIPIKASTADSKSELKLEAVVTGTFGLEISTPSGVLSDDMTAGSEKSVELVVKNTGTTSLNDVSVSANAPTNWEVKFDEEKISELKPGKTKKVKAKISAPDDAIAGDYVTTFTASADEATSEATFRISVETSTLWGIVAVLIIIAVIAGLFFITRKYGRR